MTTKKYQMWLNFNDDKTKYMFPVLPESIKVTTKGLTTSTEIDKLGEIIHKGKRGAMVISFSGFFPAVHSAMYCCHVSKFRSAETWNAYIMSLMEAGKPAHFVLTGGPMAVNIYVVITSYKAEEEGGDVGTVHYDLDMKEYRSVSIKKVSKKKKGTSSTSSNKRVTNTKKKKTYTVKKGDCLWNIAIKYYGKGKGSQYTKIYTANKSVIEKAAKKHGHKSSNRGNRIYAGTKLTIP